MAPFTIAARSLPRATAADFGVRAHPRAPAITFPALGAYVGPDIVAGVLATGPDARPAHPPLRRRRHELGDRARLLGARARDRRACGPGVRGSADPLRDARGGGRDRGREDRRRRGRAAGDRRRRAARHVRLGPRRHGRRALARGHPRAVGPLRRAPARDEDRRGARLHARRRRLPLAARRARAPVREGVDRDRLDDPCRELGIEPEEIAQVLLAGSFGSYLSAASAVRIGLVPKLPLVRIVSAGNVAGEGAKIAALSVQERAAARRSWTRSSTSSSPGAPISTTCSSTSWRSRRERRSSSRAGRWRCTCARSPPGAAGTSRCARCRRSSTTGPSGSRPRSRNTGSSDDVVLAYADCGTAGALDGYRRLARARPATTSSRTSEVPALLAEQPGTYFLTDYLVRTFDRSIWRSLGLDRYPELRDDYFRNYTRVVWLAQRPTPAAARAGRARGCDARPAARAARRRRGGLERALEDSWLEPRSHSEEALCS